ELGRVTGMDIVGLSGYYVRSVQAYAGARVVQSGHRIDWKSGLKAHERCNLPVTEQARHPATMSELAHVHHAGVEKLRGIVAARTVVTAWVSRVFDRCRA